jgi:cell wall-active antibiotic response 4TMS protein YvqF
MTDPTEPTSAPSTSRGGPIAPPPAPPGTDAPPGWGPNWAWRDRGRRRDSGGLFFGVLLLLVGGYFLLRDTLHIRLPSFGELWPILLIALGLWILLAAARRGDRL